MRLAPDLATNPQPVSSVGHNIGFNGITKEKGKEGMGAVYLAQGTRLRRAVALNLALTLLWGVSMLPPQIPES